MTFKELYDNVESRHEQFAPNSLVTAGTNMAAIESSTGVINYGASIDAKNALGIGAEQAAIASMVTCGEYEIARIIVVDANGNVIAPNGASRELMLSLSKENANTEVVIDVDNQKMVRLNRLLQLWADEKNI